MDKDKKQDKEYNSFQVNINLKVHLSKEKDVDLVKLYSKMEQFMLDNG